MDSLSFTEWIWKRCALKVQSVLPQWMNNYCFGWIKKQEAWKTQFPWSLVWHNKAGDSWDSQWDSAASPQSWQYWCTSAAVVWRGPTIYVTKKSSKHNDVERSNRETQTKMESYLPEGDLCMAEDEDVVPQPPGFPMSGPPAVPSPVWGSILACPPPLPCLGLFIRPRLLEWRL